MPHPLAHAIGERRNRTTQYPKIHTAMLTSTTSFPNPKRKSSDTTQAFFFCNILLKPGIEIALLQLES